MKPFKYYYVVVVSTRRRLSSDLHTKNHECFMELIT